LERVTIKTDFAVIDVLALARETTKEWLQRHAVLQLVKNYRLQYGANVTKSLLAELAIYNDRRNPIGTLDKEGAIR